MMQAASGCFSSAKFSCKFVGSAYKSAADSHLIALFGCCYDRLSSIFQAITDLYLIY